jgi:hypothetical protein
VKDHIQARQANIVENEEEMSVVVAFVHAHMKERDITKSMIMIDLEDNDPQKDLFERTITEDAQENMNVFQDLLMIDIKELHDPHVIDTIDTRYIALKLKCILKMYHF